MKTEELVEGRQEKKRSVAKYFRSAVSFLLAVAGTVILIQASRETKVWERWSGEAWRGVGTPVAKNERMVSLGRFFETEDGMKLKADGTLVAVLGRRDLPPHEKNFSFPIYLTWFLMPDRRRVSVILDPEEAAGYRWVFAWQDSLGKLKGTGVVAEEVWGAGKVFVYRIDGGRENQEHKTLEGGGEGSR